MIESDIKIKPKILNIPEIENIISFEKIIGVGSTSKVFLGNEKNKIQSFAFKIIEKKNHQNDIIRKRFEREIFIMKELQHPNLVTLYKVFNLEKLYCLEMDYCKGGSLLNYIFEHGKIPEKLSMIIFFQIVKAINYCHHKGVSHRDIKPENILIDDFPNIKVTDFGLSGLIQNGQLMKSFCGTISYSPPECLQHIEYDGIKCDIWSLGVLLYVMLVGVLPWRIENIQNTMDDIINVNIYYPNYLSENVIDLLQKILKKEPTERINTEEILSHIWFHGFNENSLKNKNSLLYKPIQKNSNSEIFQNKTTLSPKIDKIRSNRGNSHIISKKRHISNLVLSFSRNSLDHLC